MKGIVTVMNLAGIQLERHEIDGDALKRANDDKRRNADQYASDRRAEILVAAQARYGRTNCYVFAEWQGAMCIEPTYMKRGYKPRGRAVQEHRIPYAVNHKKAA